MLSNIRLVKNMKYSFNQVSTPPLPTPCKLFFLLPLPRQRWIAYIEYYSANRERN
jgi:hypothetical protein